MAEKQLIDAPAPAEPAAVADDAPLAVRTAPKKIWLDLGDDEAGDCDFSDLEEVTWSSNNASGCGIEYVRAALAATPALPATKDSSAGDLATESVLIEGVAYTIPEPVALELLRLNIELQLAEVQAGQVAVGEYLPLPMQYACSGWFPVYSADQMRAYADAHRTPATAPQATQPADALDERRGGKWLTVVYRDVQPGDEAREIGSHQKVAALSWSHALDDRDAAMAAAQAEPAPKEAP